MKLSHRIAVSVFSRPEDNEEEVRTTLASLFPFDLAKEKIELREQSAEGFNDKKIKIFEVSLKKDSHMNSFLDDLMRKLGDEAGRLADEVESRLDEELYFFIRLDKDMLMKERKYRLTDKGNCFHIRMSIAAFPKKRQKAIELVKEFLKR